MTAGRGKSGERVALSYTSVPQTSPARDTERVMEQESWAGEDQ